MQFVKVLYLHNKNSGKKWVGNKIVHQYVHTNNNVTSMLHYIGGGVFTKLYRLNSSCSTKYYNSEKLK